MITYPVPFVWDNQIIAEKRIVIEIDGKTKEYEIDEIKEKDKFKVGKNTYYVCVISTGFYRELEIKHYAKAEVVEENKENAGVAALK